MRRTAQKTGSRGYRQHAVQPSAQAPTFVFTRLLLEVLPRTPPSQLRERVLECARVREVAGQLR